MSNFIEGVLGSVQGGVEARNDITVFVRNWFANRNPLVTRLQYVPVDRTDFVLYGHPYRPRSTTLNAAISATTTTTMLLADASFLMNHDVLELVDSASGNRERVQLSADPTNTQQVSITRGVSSTAALGTVTSGSTVNLIGNSRQGSEINQTGLVTVGTSVTQYCQNFQYPVQIGGSAQTNRAMVMPGGIQSPLDFNQTMQLQQMVDDIETTVYYGLKEAPVDNVTTAKMAGIVQLLQTNNIGYQGNVLYSNSKTPTNANAYGSIDLIRDTLQAARKGGGEPDLLVVSTDFMQGFATWGHAVQRIQAGSTAFGTPIDLFEAPFLHGVAIVEAPLLALGTAVALTSSEVYMRPKRNPFWQERGRLGDRVEGDWIAEMALAVVNEAHHAYVEGITAFSAN